MEGLLSLRRFSARAPALLPPYDETRGGKRQSALLNPSVA